VTATRLPQEQLRATPNPIEHAELKRVHAEIERMITLKKTSLVPKSGISNANFVAKSMVLQLPPTLTLTRSILSIRSIRSSLSSISTSSQTSRGKASFQESE